MTEIVVKIDTWFLDAYNKLSYLHTQKARLLLLGNLAFLY